MSDLSNEYDYEVDQAREWLGLDQGENVCGLLTLADMVHEMLRFAVISWSVLGICAIVALAMGKI